jgi:hypothetical protein
MSTISPCPAWGVVASANFHTPPGFLDANAMGVGVTLPHAGGRFGYPPDWRNAEGIGGHSDRDFL